MEESEYEDLEDIEYIKTLYLSLSEIDKIKILLFIEDKSGLNGSQLSTVSDHCKIDRAIDDMWYISHGLPIPRRMDNENS